MLDIKFIRENPAAVKKALTTRRADADIDGLLAIDTARRAAITAETLRDTRLAPEDLTGAPSHDPALPFFMQSGFMQSGFGRNDR